MTYREISDFISFNDKLKRYLCIKNAPNYTTPHKFYKRMPTDMIERITNQIINNLNIKPKIVALDRGGFTSDNAEKYHSKIRDKERKNFTKYHIAIDVDTRLILYSQAVK
jgi:hypothetical protein